MYRPARGATTKQFLHHLMRLLRRSTQHKYLMLVPVEVTSEGLKYLPESRYLLIDGITRCRDRESGEFVQHSCDTDDLTYMSNHHDRR